jgi:hypothetical protein
MPPKKGAKRSAEDIPAEKKKAKAAVPAKAAAKGEVEVIIEACKS